MPRGSSHGYAQDDTEVVNVDDYWINRKVIKTENSIGSSKLYCVVYLLHVIELTNMGPPIGIDLGTTYSSVGVWKNNRIEIIPNDQGSRMTPSYVAFTDTKRLIGDAAKNRGSVNPSNTIYGNTLFQNFHVRNLSLCSM
nr:heat shock protein 70 family [Tanacetum cinerariifolium]